ncbi:hypothetical protein [Deminuibacter soli]|uniref:Uncharacterized protein n=1 Tax=Deminuibacter soli TaxID=2291815 RepID=A0A3E1NJ19_9BACT|nr:hypothetical protein [Deminuibacter soli]RFM27930.1 hypothetical protein DXN05_10305 [Deminuibacter soli]
MHYQFYNHEVLLLVNQKGMIKKLHTPFRVQCTTATGHFPANAWVYVDEICSTDTDNLCFIIAGNIYPHSHFLIPVKF